LLYNATYTKEDDHDQILEQVTVAVDAACGSFAGDRLYAWGRWRGDKAYIVSYVYLDGELYDGRYGPMEVTLTHSGTAKTVDLLENPFTFTDLPVAFASVKVQLVIPQGGGVLTIREEVGRTLRAGENVFQFTGLKTN
jgi:hypothetical protein